MRNVQGVSPYRYNKMRMAFNLSLKLSNLWLKVALLPMLTMEHGTHNIIELAVSCGQTLFLHRSITTFCISTPLKKGSGRVNSIYSY